jgi:type I restriction enzyme S subunit
MFEEFDIPAHWKRLKFSELASFNVESWKKTNSPELIHYIDIKSVSSGSMNEPKKITFEEAPSRARRIVKNGDIIISTVRPNLKQFLLIEGTSHINLTASTGFCVIRANDENLRWFLYALITSNLFTNYLERVSEGAAYPAFKPVDISGSIIAIPPKDELALIANLNKSITQQIANNADMNQTLEKIAQRIFKSWFIDFDPVKANAEGVPFDGLSPEIQALFPSELVESEMGLIPKGWDVKHIGDEVKCVGGGTPSTKNTAFWDGGDILWTTPKDLSGKESKVIFDTARKITFEGLGKVSSGLLPINTVLMSSRAPVGYLALARENIAINQGYIAMMCNQTLGPLYLLNWLEKNMSTIKQRAGGTTFSEISKQSFRSIEVLVPNKSLSQLFEDTVESLYRKIEINSRQNENLSTIRDNLLPKIISGQIEINNEADQSV